MNKIDIKRENGKIFCPVKNAWHVETPEELVRQEYIKILVEDYGYKLEQIDQEVPVNNSYRGQGKARADIVIWKSADDKKNNKKAFIVVECKAENVKIHQEDYYQGYNYAAWAGASFFVTTNQKEIKYFNVNPEFLPKRLEEVLAIPKASEVNDEKRLNELFNQTKTFTREEFTKLLYSCHTIIRNNDKLSPEAAFDEISKILFMKIHYERDKRGSEVFTKNKFVQLQEDYELYTRPTLRTQGIDLPYMQILFNDTKHHYRCDQLFEENEKIKIRQNSFEQILEKLEKYNLSDTQDDVKGIAFEQFLGRTFRGELGQFFTPRTVVDFMVGILDPQENEIICDPCCGSGGFLIKAFEYVRDNIEADIKDAKKILREELEGNDYFNFSEDKQIKINKNIASMQYKLNEELDTQKENSRMYNLSHNCIFGTDANPRMARTSKMNMIMHGDGHGGVYHHDGLIDVNGIFEERFDVILTNPPFGAHLDKNQKISEMDKIIDPILINECVDKYGEDYYKAVNKINNNIDNPIISMFGVGKLSGLTEVLFIDRCLQLLKKGGRMGIVLPEGILNTDNLQKVREYFEGKAKIVLICSIPQDVFLAAGATVKPSLVFMKKFTREEEEKYSECVKKVKNKLKKKYKLDELNNRLEAIKSDKKLVDERKQIKKRIDEINKVIEEEAKPLIKELFDYEILIAKVEKAGITSTGGKCENELVDVLNEFKECTNINKVWNKSTIKYVYKIDENKNIKRILDRQVL